jgi:hypothetical protein
MCAKDYDWIAQMDKTSDTITITKRGAAHADVPVTEIWADGDIFGRFFGKTLRQFASNSDVKCFVVHPPWKRTHTQSDRKIKTTVYSGFHAAWITREAVVSQRTIILHPTVYPPDNNIVTTNYAGLTVCLPRIDASVNAPPWRRWTEKAGCPLIDTPQGGKRIQADTHMTFWRKVLFDE